MLCGPENKQRRERNILQSQWDVSLPCRSKLRAEQTRTRGLWTGPLGSSAKQKVSLRTNNNPRRPFLHWVGHKPRVLTCEVFIVEKFKGRIWSWLADTWLAAARPSWDWASFVWIEQSSNEEETMEEMLAGWEIHKNKLAPWSERQLSFLETGIEVNFSVLFCFVLYHRWPT